MIRIIAASGLFIVIAVLYPLQAQDRSWEHTTIVDPLTGLRTDRFVVSGEYLISPVSTPTPEAIALFTSLGLPPPPANVDTPKLVLTCSEGRFVKRFGLVRGLPTSPPGVESKLDVVVDGKTKKTVSTTVSTNTEPGIVDDRFSYSAFDLDNILPGLLHGQWVTLVARMDPQKLSVIGGPLRQVLTEFHMPPSDPVIAACGDGSNLIHATPAAGSQPANDPIWEHTSIKDPLTDHVVDRFVLSGEYLTSQVQTIGPSLSQSVLSTMNGPVTFSSLSQNAAADTPRIVLMCADGRLIKHYGVLRGFATSSTGIAAVMDAVIDGGRKKTFSTTISLHTDRGIGDDRMSYQDFELGKLLPDLLRGKLATLVVRQDYSHLTMFSGSPRQVLSEFRLPSSAPILAVCGSDKSILGVHP
jgi:hypothetical protein